MVSFIEVDEVSFCDVMWLVGECGLVSNVEVWFGYCWLCNIMVYIYD